MFGNGNCFFCALSVSMYGHQNEYGALRAGVARFISTQSQSAALTPYDRDALRQRAAYISSNGTWAAEDIILATANNLQQAIHVYFAASGTSPMIYSPFLSKPSLSPLMLAYFEPGHYCSVAHYESNHCTMVRVVALVTIKQHYHHMIAVKEE